MHACGSGEKREIMGKKPLGRHRRRWKENIIMNLKELGCLGCYWINLAKNWHK